MTTNHVQTKGRTSTLAFILVLLTTILSAQAVRAETVVQSAPQYTDRTSQQFTASNGLTSRHHIYAAGLTAASIRCAVFQFHGDGAYEFSNPTSSYSLGGSSGIVAQSRQRGCLTVAVLSPDKAGTSTWWEDGAANAVYVRDLLTSLQAEYGFSSERVWLVGYSGGAQFVTQFYLPLYSSTIKGGGSIVFGGGGAPRVQTSPFGGLAANFRMHWYTGANDTGSNGGYNALRDAKAGESYYASRGFSTSHEYPAGIGHGLSGRFGGVVAGQLDQYGAGAAPISPPIGSLDLVQASGWSAVVAGWALDRRGSASSIQVHIYVNGVGYARVADKLRPDVNAAYNATGNHGFFESVPLAPGTNTICAYAIGLDSNNNALISCGTVESPGGPVGFVDSVSVSGPNLIVSGWALDRGFATASIDVHVYVNGTGHAFTANQLRGDVNSVFGVGGLHGFSASVPARSGGNDVCVYAIGVWPGNNALIQCRRW